MIILRGFFIILYVFELKCNQENEFGDGFPSKIESGSETNNFAAVFSIRNEDIPRKKRREFRRNKGSKLLMDHIEIPRKKRTKRYRNFIRAKKKVKYEKIREKQGDATSSLFRVTGFCRFCNVKVKGGNRQYQEHFKKLHQREKCYRCDHCSSGFLNQGNLNRHVEKFHPKYAKGFEFEIDCHLCGFHASSLEALQQHGLESHRGMGLICCPHCPLRFPHVEMYDEHVKEAHILSVVCEFCRNKFVKVKRDGIEISQNECNVCFKNEKNVGMRSVEANEELSLKIKEKGMKGEFHCEICTLSFDEGTNLRMHCYTFHESGQIVLYKRHNKGCILSCQYCRLDIRGFRNFEEHCIDEHPGRKLFRCRQCPDEFTIKTAMDRHVNDIHGDGHGFKLCKHCGVSYARLDMLKNHEMKCVFRGEGTLRNHPNYGKMARKCPVCGKRLVGKWVKFREHVDHHSIYDLCPLCDDKFHKENQPNGLEDHIRRRHTMNLNIKALLDTINEAEAVKRETEIDRINYGKDGKIETASGTEFDTAFKIAKMETNVE